MKKSILIVLLSSISLLNHSSDLTTTNKMVDLKQKKLYLEDSYANARMRLFSLFAIAIGISGFSATFFCSNSKCISEKFNSLLCCGCPNIYREYEKTPSPSLLSDKIIGSTIITASITALIPHILEAYNDLQKASKKIAEIEQQIKMLGSVN